MESYNPWVNNARRKCKRNGRNKRERKRMRALYEGKKKKKPRDNLPCHP